MILPFITKYSLMNKTNNFLFSQWIKGFYRGFFTTSYITLPKRSQICSIYRKKYRTKTSSIYKLRNESIWNCFHLMKNSLVLVKYRNTFFLYISLILLLGTLRPDLIESASSLVSSKADTIKTHHNDSRLVRELREKVMSWTFEEIIFTLT